MTFPNKFLPLQIHKTLTHYRLLNSQPITFKIFVIYPWLIEALVNQWQLWIPQKFTCNKFAMYLRFIQNLGHMKHTQDLILYKGWKSLKFRATK